MLPYNSQTAEEAFFLVTLFKHYLMITNLARLNLIF